MRPAQVINTCTEQLTQNVKSLLHPCSVVRLWGLMCAALTLLLPSNAKALSMQEMTGLASLCSEQYASFDETNDAFQDAGWSYLPRPQSEGFVVNLAVLQALDRSRHHFLLNSLNALMVDDAEPEGNPDEKQAISWVLQNTDLISAQATELWHQPSAIFLSPNDPFVGVRISFEDEGVLGWRQYCDVLSADRVATTKTLLAFFPNQRSPSEQEYSPATEARYALRPINPSPTAVIPIAYARIFDLDNMQPAPDSSIIARAWINIRVGIREPTDLTPIEVNP
jgi:hypothetical protein